MDERLNIDITVERAPDRVRVWRELVRERYFGLECETDVEDFQARLEGRWLDGGSVARSCLARQKFERTPQLVGRATDASILFLVGSGGTSVFEQGGKEAVVEPGDFCVVDPLRPYSLTYASERGGSSLLHVSKASIVQRVGAVDDIAFTTFRAADPLCRLASHFLEGLAEWAGRLDAETANTLLDQALDLFALPIAEAKRGIIDPSTHRAATLLRVKSYVRAHLREEALTIDRTAAALGISSRYVNALFAAEETSFGRYVLAQRLDGAYRELTDARRGHERVGELAYRWGFANPSHFARVFKARYGVTPSDARGGGAPT